MVGPTAGADVARLVVISPDDLAAKHDTKPRPIRRYRPRNIRCPLCKAQALRIGASVGVTANNADSPRGRSPSAWRATRSGAGPPGVTAQQTHFPRVDLSSFLAGILASRERHGETVDLQEGPTEHGSDLVIELSHEFLDRPVVIGLQVKSCEGSVSADTVRIKLDQLIRGWEDNTLDYGALVLSGDWTADADKALAEHNQNNPQRRVKKVDGTQLARIVTGLTWMEDS